jgi:predicted transcriptional regulator
MIKPCLTPGTYRLSELAEILGVSRTSVDRYIERYSLELTTITHLNKPVKAVILNEQDIEQITTVNTQGVNTVETTRVNKGNPQQTPPGSPGEQTLFTQEQTLFNQVLELQKELTQEKVERARLEGELKRIQEVIDAHRETIDSYKATLLLEAKRQNLPPEKTLEYGQIALPKNGFMSRLKAIFNG